MKTDEKLERIEPNFVKQEPEIESYLLLFKKGDNESDNEERIPYSLIKFFPEIAQA